MASDETDSAGSEPGSSEKISEIQTRLQRYEALIQNLPHPVFVIDRRGYLTFSNRTFRQTFGYVPSPDSELHVSELLVDEDVELVINCLREMVAHEPEDATPDSLELNAITKTGRTRIFQATLIPLIQQASFEGAATLFQDITLQRRREDVFTVMDRALRHNLRTNVNLITGYLDQLQDEVDDRHHEIFDRVNDAVRWIYKLGDSLRTIQTAVDESVVNETSTGVSSIVEGAISTVRDEHPGGELSVQSSAEGQVYAGKPIQYALENIIENAIEHNDQDPPTAQILVSHALEDEWIEIHVADNGPGIPDMERKIVLGNASVDQLQHGSGLGLWITRWVVDMVDGELEIESNKPRGSVVTLRLPLSED